MAKLEVVITSDGEGWYLSDGDENETEESAPWGDVLEFKGTLYRADVDESGNDVSLFKVTALSDNAYEVVSELEEDEESEEESEEEEEVETK